VAATGGVLLAAMVDALPLLGAPPELDSRLAARLWPRLTARPAQPADIDALNAALVLLADHDLAASTVAARVAASARAHPYAVVAAGLAALDGPLHGVAVSQAYRVLAEAIDSGDPLGVYSERLRTDGRVPGFAIHVHHLYPDGDVRAAALSDMLARAPVPLPVRAAVDGLVAAASDRSARHPTIDFALAALTHGCGMTADAGEAIFAVARTAGWIAHAIEEYQEPGLRFRLSGTYTGPQPG
jgi:citrate synthase